MSSVPFLWRDLGFDIHICVQPQMIVWPPRYLNASNTSDIIVRYIIIVMYVRKCSVSTILYNEFMLHYNVIRRELCTYDKVGIEMSLLLSSPQEEHHCVGSPFVLAFLYMYVCILCVCMYTYYVYVCMYTYYVYVCMYACYVYVRTYMDKFTLFNSKKKIKIMYI